MVKAAVASFLILLNVSKQTSSPDEFVNSLRSAVFSAKFDNLNPFFVMPSYSNYLKEMTGRAENLKKLGVAVFPAPPGLERMGNAWVVFYKYQTLEADHDPIHPFASTGEGIKLGAELPEDIYIPYEISKLKVNAKLFPADSKANFEVAAEIKKAGEGPPTVLMRMSHHYVVKSAKYKDKGIKIHDNLGFSAVALSKSEPELVRAGSVMYLTNAGAGGQLTLNYSTTINEFGGDQMVLKQALFTSYWYPHIGRKPSASEITVEGPKDWLILANGNEQNQKDLGDRKSVAFKNDVPVCYHHIVAGPYVLAAKTEDRGRVFRSWHLNQNDSARAIADVNSAKNSIAFFEDNFGKYPYNAYDIVDTPSFYGVECYSFTVLTPRITSWATSHEIGHTWFGGVVPNSYIHSIWNESITQYVDSILFKKNSDKTLESGYNFRKQSVALTQSFTAHGPFGNVGYYRGAYTMKMLENEIGTEAMMDSLRRFLTERKGKLSEWSDVELSFKKINDVGWFFDQWVRNSKFPTISIEKYVVEPGPETGFNTSIRFAQSGTNTPYRLRFEVQLQFSGGSKSFVAYMQNPSEQFNFATQVRPNKITINPIGFTLADVPAPIEIQ